MKITTVETLSKGVACLAVLLVTSLSSAQTQTTGTLNILASPADGGTTGPAVGSYTYNVGQTISVKATPNQAQGYAFVNWTVWGGATVASATADITTIQFTGDATLTANFAKQGQLSFAVSPSGAGVTNPFGFVIITQGVAQNITATASGNYAFRKWSTSAGATVANPYSLNTTATLTADSATVTAFFDNPAQLIVVAPSDGSGTVSPSGAVIVTQTVAQTITATPAANYHFVSWTATDGALLANPYSPSTTVALYVAAATVTASFGRNMAAATMAVLPVGSGSTTPSPGLFSTETQQPLNILALPADDYIFLNWAADSAAILTDASSDSCYANFTGDATVTANFLQVFKGQKAKYSQSYIQTKNKSGADVFREGFFFSMTVKGDFSVFTNGTPLVLNIGALSVFENIGTAGGITGFTTIGEALGMAGDGALTAQVYQGKGRGTINGLLYREVETEGKTVRSPLMKANITWNNKQLKVTVSYGEYYLTDSQTRILPEVPVILSGLNQAQRSFALKVAPIYLTFGAFSYAPTSDLMEGQTFFTPAGSLWKAVGQIK